MVSGNYVTLTLTSLQPHKWGEDVQPGLSGKEMDEAILAHKMKLCDWT